jgi:hypothetical protein
VVVGVAGFEPATPSSRTRCASRLRTPRRRKPVCPGCGTSRTMISEAWTDIPLRSSACSGCGAHGVRARRRCRSCDWEARSTSLLRFRSLAEYRASRTGCFIASILHSQAKSPGTCLQPCSRGKRLEASRTYCSGRTDLWLKSKCIKEQELVVGGTPSSLSTLDAGPAAGWLIRRRRATLFPVRSALASRKPKRVRFLSNYKSGRRSAIAPRR